MHTQTPPASSPLTSTGTTPASLPLPCAHVYGVQFSTVVCTVCGESAAVIRAREGVQSGLGSWDTVIDVMAAPAAPAPVAPLPTLLSPVELHALAVSSLHPLPTAPLVSRRPASQWLAYAAGAVGVVAMTVIVAVTLAIHAPVQLPPCATEDSSTACYWDADTRGNGEGRSFTVTDDGTVNYR